LTFKKQINIYDQKNQGKRGIFIDVGRYWIRIMSERQDDQRSYKQKLQWDTEGHYIFVPEPRSQKDYSSPRQRAVQYVPDWFQSCLSDATLVVLAGLL
jgi:hypothetical protein